MLQNRLHRVEWSPKNEDEIGKLGQQIAFNDKQWGLYIMGATKMILSILHRGFDKIKQDSKVMVSDQQSAKKLYNRLRLEKSDGDTYSIAFENESGTLKDVLSPDNRWLVPKHI